MRIRENKRRRKKAFVQQALRSVQIDQNGVEEGRTLDYRLFNRCPFSRIDDKRNGIHWPGIFASFRQAADVVGDALRLDQLLAGLPAAAELTEAHPAEFYKSFRQ